MPFLSKQSAIVVSLLSLLFFGGCGIMYYPGQPGVVTNSFSKIDYEDLEFEGLYVYETTYDNRAGGKGVGAIVTKLYPNAQTNTSNVRTNADGTVYRAKQPYKGAMVQMISIPQQEQIILPPDSSVFLLLMYVQSLDEIDDINLAEQSLFVNNPAPTVLSRVARAVKAFRFDALRAGKLLPNGNLSYEVTSVELGKVKFVPSKPIQIETNFGQTGVHTNLSVEIRKEAQAFVEENFPKGYNGEVKLHVKGTDKPLAVKVGLHTVKTAEAAGMTVIKNASPELIEQTLKRFNVSTN
jgi:hypothetical protein